MPKEPFSDLLLYLRKVCSAQAARDLTDAELVERFRAQRDEAAFSVLVHRHGPMVLGACRRVLGNSHDAEDAFQAAFLILARRAKSISRTGSVGPWLHAVAQRVATKARRQETTRRQQERRVPPMPTSEPLDDLTTQELLTALDTEIASLPEKYRAAVVLCYLESKSYDQAARELGWSKTSVSRRLSEARELLRERLVRRGITLSAGALVTVLCEKVSGPAVGAMLTINTVKAAASIAAGKAVAAACASAQAVALAEKVGAGLGAIKVSMLAMLLAVGVAVGAAGVASYAKMDHNARSSSSAQAPMNLAKFDTASQKKETPRPTDLYGDPLPPGAIARLGTVRFRATGHARRPGLGFLADSKTIASVGDDQTVQIWDAATGKLIREVRTGIYIDSFAMSPDGKSFAGEGYLLDDGTGPESGAVGIWDAASGKEVRKTKRSDKDIGNSSIAFTPDGKLLVSLAMSGVLRIQEVATGVELQRRQFPPDSGGTIAVSPDGSMLAIGTGANTKKFYLWKWKAGEEPREMKVTGRVAEALAFSPDGKTLAECSQISEVVRLWDVKSGTVLRKLELPDLDWHLGIYVVFAPDGRRLIALTRRNRDGAAHIWDTATWKHLRRLDQPVSHLAVSPDSRLVAGAGRGVVRVFDLASGKELAANDEAHDANVSQIAVNGDLVVTAGDDYTIRLWDATTGKQRLKLTHGNWVRGMALSPDGTKVVSSSFDDTVCLWDVATGRKIFKLPGHGPVGGQRAVGFTPDGKYFMSWGDDMYLRKYEVATGKAVLEHALRPKAMPRPADELEAGEFSGDGKTLVLRTGNQFHMFDVTTGKDLYQIPSEEFWVNSLALSPDSRLLLASAWGKSISTILPDGNTRVSEGKEHALTLWELATRQVRKQVMLPGTISDRVAFSPDNKYFAAGTADPECCIHIWNLASGNEIGVLKGYRGRLNSLAFARDSERLVSGMDDTTVLVWDLKAILNAGKKK